MTFKRLKILKEKTLCFKEITKEAQKRYFVTDLEYKKENLKLIIDQLHKITKNRVAKTNKKNGSNLYFKNPFIGKFQEIYSSHYIFKKELNEAKKQSYKIDTALKNLRLQIRELKQK